MSRAIDALKGRRRLFVEFYLQNMGQFDDDGLLVGTKGNATQAARMAGYRHPEVQGCRLLRNVQVEAAIAERLAEIVDDTDAYLRLEHEVAVSDMGDFADVFEQPTIPRMLRRAKELGLSHLIEQIHETEHGVRLRLYSAHTSRELMGERLGLWKPKAERGNIDLTKLPPVLRNIMAATSDEILEALDQIQGRRGDDG